MSRERERERQMEGGREESPELTFILPGRYVALDVRCSPAAAHMDGMNS